MKVKRCQKCKTDPKIKSIEKGFQFSCQCGSERVLAVIGIPRERAICIYNQFDWTGTSKKS